MQKIDTKCKIYFTAKLKFRSLHYSGMSLSDPICQAPPSFVSRKEDLFQSPYVLKYPPFAQQKNSTYKKTLFSMWKKSKIYTYLATTTTSPTKITVCKSYKSDRIPNPGPLGSSVKVVKPSLGSEAKRPLLKQQQ